MNIRFDSDVTRDFVIDRFNQKVLEQFNDLEIIRMDYRDDMPMMFLTVNEANEFCPKGRPVVAVNLTAELFRYTELPIGLIDSALIHEGVHVNQYQEGRLYFHPESTFTDCRIMWEGEEHPNNVDDLSLYVKSPWELEAFEAQGEYIDEFNNQPKGTWVNHYIQAMIES
jgi:hypothetical protein